MTLEERKNSFKNSTSYITTKELVKKYTSNPDFPYLVSFPRTGSHWLRSIMELYFGIPSLCRIFTKGLINSKEFTCYHRHDLKLNLKRKNVLYLYRNPVETIYSIIRYYKKDVFNTDNINYYTNLYCKHLKKWLYEDDFTKKKTIIKYELLKKEPEEEFKKVCDHFNKKYNKESLIDVINFINKKMIKNKTGYDKQVMNISNEYVLNQIKFIEEKSNFIYDIVNNYKLNNIFK